MSDSSGQNEPSMEEILASIRRIISEDSADKPAGAPAPAAAAKPAAPAAARAAPEADPAGDVLVLTEVVDDDGAVVTADSAKPEPRRPSAAERRGAVQEAAEAEPAARPSARSRLEPVEPSATTTVEEARPSAAAAKGADGGLLSRRSAAAAATAFAQLSTAIPKDMPALGGGVSLEAFVRQALEPMLREWLDTNLPHIIERLVREEIERVVRSGGRL
jgi:uncharacterized protein